MKELWKNAGILFVIMLIAGLLLGVVNEVTKEPIKEQRAQAKERALKAVFSEDSENGLKGGSTFEAVSFDADKCASILKMEGYPEERVDEITKVFDEDGELLGYVLLVTSKEGYAGEISFTMGIRLDGTLNGISLTTINETVGLGMNAKKVLVPQFAGKNVTSFVYSKEGASAANEVDAISSATYTTSAIVNGVNSGLVIYRHIEEVL